MNPNRMKDQQRTTIGKNQPNSPREKQREEKSTAKPDERQQPGNETMDPVGTPETKRSLEDKKGNPAGQKYDPQPGRQPPEDPGFEPDALEPKPGR